MTRRTEIPTSLTAEDALVATMIAVSAADTEITTLELLSIQQMIGYLPVFSQFDTERITTISQTVFDLLEEEDGLDALFGLVGQALPTDLNETAYAFACDVAAASGQLHNTELRFLQEMRDALDIDRLHAAAIERGSRARHRKLPET